METALTRPRPRPKLTLPVLLSDFKLDKNVLCFAWYTIHLVFENDAKL